MDRPTAVSETAHHRQRLRARYNLPISTQQRETQRDPGTFNLPLNIVKTGFAHPGSSNLVNVLVGVIERLGESEGAGRERVDVPDGLDVRGVEGEWCAWGKGEEEVRDGVLGEREKWRRMMRDAKRGVGGGVPVMLFVHGGAFYLGNPATSRPVVAQLVKNTGGLAFSVRYRLAPQHPFPAPILDVIVSYLSLLYPPPGAIHDPIPASSIVFVGESSGANLCFAALQFILELGRQSGNRVPKVLFHGREVEMLVPAGLASVCGMLDLTRSLPSWTRKDDYDLYGAGPGPYLQPDFPKCEAWPTDPPRGELYCDVSAMCHPLVSPTAAKDWSGSPPLFICVGEERAADCNLVLARRAAGQGVKVVCEQFEAMPHLFFLLMAGTENVKMCYRDWAGFCRRCVDERETMRSESSLVEVQSLKRRAFELDALRLVSYEEALRLMRARRDAGGTITIKAKF
ncbi:hypothetical protein ACLMJK_007805 [Lecanora helva]